MNKRRLFFALVSLVAAGAVTPWLIPDDWLSYAFYACALFLLIFGTLAAGSAENRGSTNFGLVSWLVIGTSRPLAKVKDPQALAFFFLTLAYMVGLTIGAFAAIRA